MTDHDDVIKAPLPPARQAAVWRRLVTFQLVVLGLMLLSLLVVFLMGVFGPLFVEHGT